MSELPLMLTRAAMTSRNSLKWIGKCCFLHATATETPDPEVLQVIAFFAAISGFLNINQIMKPGHPGPVGFIFAELNNAVAIQSKPYVHICQFDIFCANFIFNRRY